MSEERGCISRLMRLGCGLALVIFAAAVTLGLYAYWTSSLDGTPEPSPASRETAASKADALSRSLRAGRPYDTEFSEAELTALARGYLAREGIDGDVEVTLPGEDLQISFQTTVQQLERFIRLDELPSWIGSDVRGALRAHLSVVDRTPVATLESASLYGVPLPLALLGADVEGNLIDRLDPDSRAVVRRIQYLEIRDATLYVSTE